MKLCSLLTFKAKRESKLKYFHTHGIVNSAAETPMYVHNSDVG